MRKLMCVCADVHDKFGTLEDCQRLIDEAHARGLKVLFGTAQQRSRTSYVHS